MIIAKFGTNVGTKLIVPSTERSSLIVVGVFNSTMALIGSSPINANPVNGQHMPNILNFLRSKMYFGWF